jgi:hypothetical protein
MVATGLILRRSPAAGDGSRTAPGRLSGQKMEIAMRVVLAAIVGFGLGVNGLLMLGMPEVWYALYPGVAATGPFNPHFVRDIGAAYLVSGGALVGFAIDARARMAALAGAAFLSLHALVHLADLALGRESPAHLLVDLPAIFAPALIALWLAWPRRAPIQKAMRHA